MSKTENTEEEKPLDYPMTVPQKPRRFGHGLVSDEDHAKEVKLLKDGKSVLKPAEGTKAMDAAREAAKAAKAGDETAASDVVAASDAVTPGDKKRKAENKDGGEA